MEPYLELLVTLWVTVMQVKAGLTHRSLQHVAGSFSPLNRHGKHTTFLLYCIFDSGLEAHGRHVKSRAPPTKVASMAAATPLAAISSADCTIAGIAVVVHIVLLIFEASARHNCTCVIMC